jgi:hypothetical protein
MTDINEMKTDDGDENNKRYKTLMKERNLRQYNEKSCNEITNKRRTESDLIG